MVERASAVEGHDSTRRFGVIGPDGPRIRLTERRLDSAWLIAAWPERLAETGAVAAKAAGTDAVPGPGQSATGSAGTLLRTEPLKWMLISETPVDRPPLDAACGTTLDLGHARTVIHVSGPALADFMARMTPLDLRPANFPDGSVANTGLHHMGVTLLARDGGIDILVLRSFGLAVWDALIEVAAQFGGEIT